MQARQVPAAAAKAAYVLAAVAVVLALTCNTWDWPDEWEPDEVIGRAVWLLHGQLLPPNYLYGSIPAFLQAAAFAVVRAFGLPMDSDYPYAGVVTARALSAALLGLSAGLGTLLIARLWGTLAGLTYGLAIALNPLLVTVCHFGTVEPTVMALVVAALMLYLHLVHDRGSAFARRLLELAAGAVTGVKSYIVPVVLMPLSVTLQRAARGRRLAAVAATLVFIAIGYWLAHPTMIVEPLQWAHDQVMGAVWSKTAPVPVTPLHGPWTYLRHLAHAAGPILLLMAIVGAVGGLRQRRPWAPVLVAVACLDCLLFFDVYWVPLRYVVPALPVLAVLAAYAARWIEQRSRRLAVGAIVALALWGAMQSTVALLYFAYDGRRLARAWLAQNVEPGDIVRTFRHECSPPPPARHLFIRQPFIPIHPSRSKGLRTLVKIKCLITREPFEPAWQRQLELHEKHCRAHAAYLKTLTREFHERHNVRWIVVTDRWLARYEGRSDALGKFVADLQSGRLGYDLVKTFRYRIPGPQPPMEFVNPAVLIFKRREAATAASQTSAPAAHGAAMSRTFAPIGPGARTGAAKNRGRSAGR